MSFHVQVFYILFAFLIYILHIYIAKKCITIINKMLLLKGKENDHIYEYSRKLFIPHPKISLMYQPAVGRKQELFSPKENIDNSSNPSFGLHASLCLIYVIFNLNILALHFTI